MPSPGRMRTFRFMFGYSATAACAASPANLASERRDLFVHQALLAIGQRGEAVVDSVEFFLCKS